MKKSWRTTFSGFISGSIMLLGQVQALIDSDPTTNPDYSIIAAAIGMILLGLNARDEHVTSKKAGLP